MEEEKIKGGIDKCQDLAGRLLTGRKVEISFMGYRIVFMKIWSLFAKTKWGTRVNIIP